MSDSPLTDLQRAVLELFFALPESDGFVLAGGAALVATGLSERPTQDVDLFGSDLTSGVTAAADALEIACAELGWPTERIRDTATFRRLVVRRTPDELLVDLAIDSPPLGPPTITAVGPTFAPEELAARKLLALFDRAAARDFVDLHALSEHFELERIQDLAAELDGGFTAALLTDMLNSHHRFSDEEFAMLGSDPPQLRAFIDQWRLRLIEQ